MAEHTPARYVLMTAARNEGRYIGAAIDSVVSQTVRPARWVIVSDGSTDDTDRIVRQAAWRHPFITLLRREPDPRGRSFASQANGLNQAAESLADDRWDFIGCLDADITLEPDYYERVLSAFCSDPLLGVAGGAIHERGRHGFRERPGNTIRSVAGAVQMFRRACFETVCPFLSLPNGGLDTVAELRARKAGFSVRTLADVPVRHHRPTGGSAPPLRAAWKSGRMEYEIGYHPLYEAGVCLRRAGWGFPVLGSIAHLAGYVGAALAGRPRLVEPDLVAHLRSEQRTRMQKLLAPARFLVPFLLISIPAAGGWATEYFVDYAGGSDLVTGQSREMAWKHAPGDPLAQGFPHDKVLVPGDTVTFRAGVVYRGTIVLATPGSLSAPITYRGLGWGIGRAILDGGGVQPGGFTLQASCLRVEGFEIRAMSSFGIWHDSAWTISGIQIIRNSIHDIGAWPAAFTPPLGNALYLRFVDGVLIQGDEHYRVSGDACRIADATDVTLRGNDFHDGQVDAFIGGAHGHLVIDGNVIHGFQNVQTHGDGMQIMSGDIVQVTNNLVYDNTQDIYFDTFLEAMGICVVADNVVVNTAPGPDGLQGAYNGVVVDNRYHPIGAIYVYQNTFVNLDNGSGGFHNEGGSTGGLPIGEVAICNNVFSSSINQVDSSAITVLSMDYNDYFNPARASYLAGLRSAFPASEQHSIQADPLLDPTSEWQPRPGSPVIDAGCPLDPVVGIAVNVDRDGGSRPTGRGWDLGAYEYGSDAARLPAAPSGLRIIP